jgi:hypothetical protein
MPRSRRAPVALLASTLVAIIAGVHFQQYVDFISQVPTIGDLFLLNAAGGAGLALALLSADRRLRLLAALGSAGLAVGSLVSIAIALNDSLFGYSEPTLRLPIVIAIVAELAAIPVLLLVSARELRGGSNLRRDDLARQRVGV